MQESIAPDELRSSCAKAPLPGAFAFAAHRHGTCGPRMETISTGEQTDDLTDGTSRKSDTTHSWTSGDVAKW